MSIFYWIIEFIASFVEAYSSFLFCNLFLPYSKLVRRDVFISLGMAFLTILLNKSSLVSYLNTIILLIVYWLIQFILRKKQLFELLFVILLYYSFVFALGYSFYLFIGKVTNIPINILLEAMSPQRTAVVVCTNSTLLILCHFLNTIKISDCLNTKKNNFIFCLSTIFITIIATVMYITQVYQVKYDTQFFMLLFFIILVLMILIIYFSIVNMIKTKYKEQEYNLIMQQNKMLINNIEEQENIFNLWKQSIHDYKHKISVLHSLVETNKYNEIREILEKELDGFKNNAFYINTGNRAVDIIINSKMNLAKKNNIIFTVNIMLDEKLNISDYDLCVILGNLIDNAIEAVEDEISPVIYVQMNYIKNLFLIKVINTYSKNAISYETTKEDSDFHGIGLKSIKRIVDKYNGNFSIELKNNYVTAIVTI